MLEAGVEAEKQRNRETREEESCLIHHSIADSCHRQSLLIFPREHDSRPKSQTSQSRFCSVSLVRDASAAACAAAEDSRRRGAEAEQEGSGISLSPAAEQQLLRGKNILVTYTRNKSQRLMIT